MNLYKIKLFFVTVSYLRPKQIIYQLYYRLARINPLRNFSPKLPERIDYAAFTPATPFVSYDFWQEHDLEVNSFIFLNKTVEFGENIDWQPDGAGRLWIYNLHYFQYLMNAESLSQERALALINDWIKDNQPGTPDAWDPFPISLRVVNWFKYLSSNEIADALPIAWSAYEQMLWLERNIEFHIMGNHLFKNAKALVFAGLYFQGPLAQRWLTKGMAILGRELDEQVLEDGGHFERSPMYHSMILEDCLDLLNICQTSESDEDLSAFCVKLRVKCSAMADFLLNMRHPDGYISLFNDAALGIEARPVELLNYYARLTGEMPDDSQALATSFRQTGYYIMAPSTTDRLIVDCGPIGPDYLPGHAHCDTLSFELSLKGHRVVVDSGCCQYEDSDIRQYNRGNLGHNTVTIDGINQSEVWSAHRCGRRAYPLYASLDVLPEGALQFRGAHDGYRHLMGHPVHHRMITWFEDVCRIEDFVDGRGRHSIETRLHINPDLEVSKNGDGVAVSVGGEVIATITATRGHIDIVKGFYCPEFGIQRECAVLSVNSAAVELPWQTGWTITTR